VAVKIWRVNVRLILFAIFIEASAGAAGAQPDKDSPRGKADTEVAAAPVVLASASDVRQPAPASKDQSAPAQRPAPRITTCRCGEAQVTGNKAAEEQPEE
jgi:hypothetical protein